MTRGKKPVRQYEALKILWELRNRNTNEVRGPCIFLRRCGFNPPSIVIRQLEQKGFILIETEDKRHGVGLRGGIIGVGFTENGIAKIHELCEEPLKKEERGNDSKNECNGALNNVCGKSSSGLNVLADTPPAPSLTNLIPARGRGALQKNLHTAFRALWSVAKDGVVDRPKKILEEYTTASLKYLNLLEDAGCIEITVSGGRGKAIQSVRLLRESLPELKRSAEQIVSRQSEALPADPASVNGSEKSGCIPHPDNIAIFIDVPNLVARGSLGVYRIHWPSLVNHIAATRTVKQVFAYVAVPARIANKDVFDWQPVVAMHNAGIKVIWRRGAETGGRKVDIDQMMNYDLGVFACTPSDVGTLILVTGDDDFSHAVCDIMKRKKIKIEIYCWKGHISPASSLWTYAKIQYLDAFAGQFLSTSAV